MIWQRFERELDGAVGRWLDRLSQPPPAPWRSPPQVAEERPRAEEERAPVATKDKPVAAKKKPLVAKKKEPATAKRKAPAKRKKKPPTATKKQPAAAKKKTAAKKKPPVAAKKKPPTAAKKPAVAQTQGADASILTALGGEDLKRKDLETATGLGRAELGRQLRELVRTGAVERIGDGMTTRYRRAAKG